MLTAPLDNKPHPNLAKAIEEEKPSTIAAIRAAKAEPRRDSPTKKTKHKNEPEL